MRKIDTQSRRSGYSVQADPGGSDPYLNSGVVQELVAKSRDATLVTLSAGHWPQIDEPQEVVRAMLQP